MSFVITLKMDNITEKLLDSMIADPTALTKLSLWEMKSISTLDLHALEANEKYTDVVPEGWFLELIGNATSQWTVSNSLNNMWRSGKAKPPAKKKKPVKKKEPSDKINGEAKPSPTKKPKTTKKPGSESKKVNGVFRFRADSAVVAKPNPPGVNPFHISSEESKTGILGGHARNEARVLEEIGKLGKTEIASRMKLKKRSR